MLTKDCRRLKILKTVLKIAGHAIDESRHSRLPAAGRAKAGIPI